MNRIKNITNPLMWFMALLLAAFVAGCGGSSGGSPTPLNPPVNPPGGSALAAVDLMTAGGFAILANTAITCTTPCTAATSAVPAVTGDVAISGVGTSITGFTITRDATDDFWTAPQAASSVRFYTTDNMGAGTGGSFTMTGTAATPPKVSKATTDMINAYNDAQTRAPGTGTFLNAGVGTIRDIGGLTLAPGVYTWTAPVNVTIGSDVTLGDSTATANDVWIFQIPGYLTQAAATHVLLGVNVKAKNIFWQVGDYVTLLGTAHMEGVMMSKTAITTGAGGTVNGRLLSQDAVTLAGAVTAP